MSRVTTTPAMLLARVRLLAPEARTLLLSFPRDHAGTSLLGQRLQASASSIVEKVNVLDAANFLANDGDSPTETVSGHRQPSAPVAASAEITLVLGAGVLDDATTLLTVPQVDGVLLLIEPGKTLRDDVEQARTEIQRAGGRLLGAVLQAN